MTAASTPREVIATAIANHYRAGVDRWECRCGERITGTSRKAERNHQADAILSALSEAGYEVVRLEDVTLRFQRICDKLAEKAGAMVVPLQTATKGGLYRKLLPQEEADA